MVHGVDNVAAIELEEPMSDSWMISECDCEHRTNQETVGHPTVQGEHNIPNDTDRLGVNESLVSIRSEKYNAVDTRECAVINEGTGLNGELDRGSYSDNREHGRCIGYESPFDRLPSAIVGVE